MHVCEGFIMLHSAELGPGFSGWSSGDAPDVDSSHTLSCFLLVLGLGRGQLYLQLQVVHQLCLPRRAFGVHGDRPLHDGTV